LSVEALIEQVAPGAKTLRSGQHVAALWTAGPAQNVGGRTPQSAIARLFHISSNRAISCRVAYTLLKSIAIQTEFIAILLKDAL
jgi:hypothetical protein